MPDNNVIKFGKAGKKIKRQQREIQAQENRVKFGRTKAQKQADKTREATLKTHVEAHKRELGEEE